MRLRNDKVSAIQFKGEVIASGFTNSPTFTGETICNICKSPRLVHFKEEEVDEETRKVRRVEKKHVCGCGGHPGIHPSLWNRHPDHWRYEQFEDRRELGWRGMGQVGGAR